MSDRRRRVGPLSPWFLAAITCTLGSACGTSAGTTAHFADLTTYLLRLDQLVTSDFTVVDAPHAVSAAELAGAGAADAGRLRSDGLLAAASVQFFRATDLAFANGPVDIIATVERFAAVDGAHASFESDANALAGTAGATAISTGPLGDESHATSAVRTPKNGVSAVQFTVEWRTGALVNIIVVRGRYGGTRLADALTLAHRQAADQDASD